jgi:CRP-like cAMP-binding protein
VTEIQPSPIEPMIRKLGHWVRLDNEDRDALRALPYRLKTVESAQYIVRHGDKPVNSCLLLSGYAYRHKIVANGARQIVSIHMAGDLVDLQNSFLGTADHNVQSLTMSDVALIPREAIRAIAAERPRVGEAMWYDTLVDASVFREWIANVGRRNARMRLAHLLCEFATRFEAAGIYRHGNFDLPMTQEQLADCTGLTSVHVNRTLKALEGEGLISRTHRSVTIDNWKALARAADFQSDYLHLNRESLHMESLSMA